MNGKSCPKAAPGTLTKASTAILASPADQTSDAAPSVFQPLSDDEYADVLSAIAGVA